MKKPVLVLLLIPFISKAQCFPSNPPQVTTENAEVITLSGKAGNATQVYKIPITSLTASLDDTIVAKASQNKVFTVNAYTGTAIQKALDSANLQGGGEVYAPDGIYLIGTILTIGSNTKLALAPNAIFRRNATINAMLINKYNGTTGGYGQATNIEITGGTWDLNKSKFPTNVTGIATGHASCIYIHNTKIINCYGWHFIELNATQNAIIKNVIFKEMSGAATSQEMMQFDLMVTSGVFPWFGPYDNTPCDNILVEGCLFENGGAAIGSHSSKLNYWHTNIKINNCHFKGMQGAAIKLYDYQQVSITNNTFTDCWQGIYASTIAKQTCKDYIISGNIMKNMKSADLQSRGIYIAGINTTARYLKDITLSNNIIKDCGRHGIGTDYCENVIINNNQVSNNGGTGIWLYRSSTVVAKGNVCFNNNFKSVGVGDFGIGATSGVSTDAQHILFSDNQAGTVYCNYGATNRLIFTNNIITGTFSTAGTKANHRVFNNYIAGVWAP